MTMELSWLLYRCGNEIQKHEATRQRSPSLQWEELELNPRPRTPAPSICPTDDTQFGQQCF